MMLGFKKQFAPYVEEGSKRHTIREKGGRQWRPGMVADCFVNPRQKNMRCLGRWPVTRVESIWIRTIPDRDRLGGSRLEITVAGERLSPDEANALAWRDGFRGNGRNGALAQMLGFWAGRFPFAGVMIHWDFDHPAGSPEERKPRGGKPGRPRVAA